MIDIRAHTCEYTNQTHTLELFYSFVNIRRFYQMGVVHIKNWQEYNVFAPSQCILNAMLIYACLLFK